MESDYLRNWLLARRAKHAGRIAASAGGRVRHAPSTRAAPAAGQTAPRVAATPFDVGVSGSDPGSGSIAQDDELHTPSTRPRPYGRDAALIGADGVATPLKRACPPLDPSEFVPPGLRRGGDRRPGFRRRRARQDTVTPRLRHCRPRIHAVPRRRRARATRRSWRSGSTLNPAVRFFVFDDRARTWIAWCRRRPERRCRAGPRLTTATEVVDRVFWYALGRAPSADGARASRSSALADPARPGRLSAEGLADLLWAVMMKPEFQLIY